jgi:hypothetical protein
MSNAMDPVTLADVILAAIKEHDSSIFPVVTKRDDNEMVIIKLVHSTQDRISNITIQRMF